MTSIFEKFGYEKIALSVSVAMALLFFVVFTFIWPMGELQLYDLRLKWMRNYDYNPNIMVVSIDQESLNKYGAFPWKRTVYSRLIASLKKNPPKMLVFDILFQEPRPEDEEFARTMKSSSFPIILPYNFGNPDATGNRTIIPIVGTLKEASKASGFINYQLDQDGRVRKAFIATKKDGKDLFSLDLVAFALLKGVSPDKIVLEKNRILVGDSSIPVDDEYRLYINYFFSKDTGSMKITFPVKSFYKFIENPDKIPDLKETVLIIGAGTPGMQDDFPTPVEDKTYGAVIHANIIDTLLRNHFIVRAPVWVNLAVVLVISFIFGLLISRFYTAKNIAMVSSSILFIYSLINLFLFKAGYWLDWLTPVFTTFSCALVVSGIQFFRTRKLLQQFVTPEIVDQMVSSDKHSELGGVEKEVTVLFSDIRGYTSLSEKMTPSQVMQMLNEYHTEMIKTFEKNYGRVVDYMGDAQMVVFGAPIERENHAECACKAAMEAQDTLQNLCDRWSVENKESFEVGIGICTGIAAVGLVGAEGHKQYTAIGDCTNIASRLQGQSKVLGAPIIIASTTASKVKDRFNLLHLGKVELKGKSEPMEVFTISLKEYTGENRTTNPSP